MGVVSRFGLVGFAAAVTCLAGCLVPTEITLNDCLVALENEDVDVQIGAMEALGTMGEHAAPAARRLSLFLGSQNPELAAGAARALGRIGPVCRQVSASGLLETLKDKRESYRFGPVWANAAQALGRFGPDILPELIPLLESPDTQLARAAAFAIHYVGPAAQPAVPHLIALLRKNDPATRREAIFALQGIGPAAAEAVPALIEALNCREDFHTQYWACRALGSIGAGARPAVPVLIVLVHEGVTSVRRNAAATLGLIGPDIGAEGIAALIAAVSDPVEPVREQAVIALGRLGPAANTAVPTLRTALTARRLHCRPHAAYAFWQITGDSQLAVNVLCEELKVPEHQVVAINHLGLMGPAAEPALDRLIASLDDEDPEVRIAAAEAIAQIGARAVKAVPALKRLLFDREEDVRQAAESALRAMNIKLPEKAQLPVGGL